MDKIIITGLAIAGPMLKNTSKKIKAVSVQKAMDVTANTIIVSTGAYFKSLASIKMGLQPPEFLTMLNVLKSTSNHIIVSCKSAFRKIKGK